MQLARAKQIVRLVLLQQHVKEQINIVHVKLDILKEEILNALNALLNVKNVKVLRNVQNAIPRIILWQKMMLVSVLMDTLWYFLLIQQSAKNVIHHARLAQEQLQNVLIVSMKQELRIVKENVNVQKTIMNLEVSA